MGVRFLPSKVWACAVPILVLVMAASLVKLWLLFKLAFGLLLTGKYKMKVVRRLK